MSDVTDAMIQPAGDADGADVDGVVGESSLSLTREGVERFSADGTGVVCGLDGVNHLDPDTAAETRGMIVRVGDSVFDLGDPGEMASSVTLADDRGLSIFADRNGDGAVDRVTTMLYDGTWETWTGDTRGADPGDGTRNHHPEPGGGADSEVAAWECVETGRWG